MIAQRIICIVLGYFFGLIEMGYILGKIKNIDIRDFGSGNSGTTNTMRVLGKKAGLITFFVDALKAVFCGLLVYALFHKSCENIMFVLLLYSGFGVILGHNFPFYMKFKGGKGIAASAGMITSLAIYDWKFVVLGFFVFFISLYITKYVSFSSLMLMGSLLIEMIVWGQLGMVHNLNPECRIEAYIITGLMTALAFIRHKENIKRLAKGTERKIGEKKEA